MPKSDPQELAYLMFVVGRRMRDEAQRTADGSSSLLRFEVLRYVEEHDRPLMRELARHLLVTPPAATFLVAGLVREKCLARIVDARDRRTVRIALTPKGKRLLGAMVREKMKMVQKFFAMLTPAERAQLAAILKKISS